MPEESPAHYVRYLSFAIQGDSYGPEEFFEYTPWFASVERATSRGYNKYNLPCIPSFWRLPRPVSSLVIGANRITLPQIRSIIAQLPDLDNLLLSGSLVRGDKPPVIEAALKGRFSGRLRLVGELESFVHMLLDIPAGLHYTEVQVHSIHERVLSTVRPAGACGETLEKLLYVVDYHW